MKKKKYNENSNKWWQQQLEKLQYTVIKPLSVLKAATIYAYTLAQRIFYMTAALGASYNNIYYWIFANMWKTIKNSPFSPRKIDKMINCPENRVIGVSIYNRRRE